MRQASYIVTKAGNPRRITFRAGIINGNPSTHALNQLGKALCGNDKSGHQHNIFADRDIDCLKCLAALAKRKAQHSDTWTER